MLMIKDIGRGLDMEYNQSLLYCSVDEENSESVISWVRTSELEVSDSYHLCLHFLLEPLMVSSSALPIN